MAEISKVLGSHSMVETRWSNSRFAAGEKLDENFPFWDHQIVNGTIVRVSWLLI